MLNIIFFKAPKKLLAIGRSLQLKGKQERRGESLPQKLERPKNGCLRTAPSSSSSSFFSFFFFANRLPLTRKK